jgi:hypothetical protein
MSSAAALPYTFERDPPPDLGSLLDVLLAEDNGRFLYRGQTRLWPEPLLPCAFRRHQKTGSVYTPDSTEYGAALRRVGRSFVGLTPINFLHEAFALFYPPHVSSSIEEMALVERLSNDQYLARTLVAGLDAFETMLTDLEAALFRGRFDYWKQVIDYDHRVRIRDMVFMRPFGYLLGQALAQQYGFSSEMLDVTSNPLVAAFFAIHEAPDFCTTVPDGTGVIYRFPRPASTSPQLDIGAYDFYSCPAVLDFDELLACFCVTEALNELRSEVENFLITSFREKKEWRRWEAFRVSPMILAATRVARQSAALLVPDVICVEQETQAPLFGKVRSLMAIEDCATRDGTTLFFFRHGGDTSVCEHITREHLWPNEEDAFFEMIGNVLLTSVVLDTGEILPNRIDLLDPGYRM